MQRPTIPDDAVPGADPEQLIYCFTPWIQKVANRYYNAIQRTGAAIDMDDLIQVGRIALLDAQKKYDSAGKACFITFSFNYLRSAMLQEIKRNVPILPPGALVSLDAPCTADGDDPLINTLSDSNNESMEEHTERQEAYTELHMAIDRLKSDTKREIINKVYFEDKEFAQVAEDLHMKSGAVYAAHKEALSKLRRDEALKSVYMPLFSVGVTRFRTKWESAVEAAVLWRERQIDNQFGQGAYIAKDGHWSPNQGTKNHYDPAGVQTSIDGDQITSNQKPYHNGDDHHITITETLCS